jgi:hypothetical protein
LNWYVIVSSQACVASIWRAISANFQRIIWWSTSRLPKVLRVMAYLKEKCV